MNYSVIDGIISNLDRTTQVSGGGDTMATTTHISIFNVSAERVLLRSSNPAMIANGDQVKLVGVRGQGQFTAVACKNISSGWATKGRRQGCATIALVGFSIFGAALTVIFPLFIFIPIASGIFLWLVLRTDSRNQQAHAILNQ